jgi:hypothetical protein
MLSYPEISPDVYIARYPGPNLFIGYSSVHHLGTRSHQSMFTASSRDLNKLVLVLVVFGLS